MSWDWRTGARADFRIITCTRRRRGGGPGANSKSQRRVAGGSEQPKATDGEPEVGNGKSDMSAALCDIHTLSQPLRFLICLRRCLKGGNIASVEKTRRGVGNGQLDVVSKVNPALRR